MAQPIKAVLFDWGETLVLIPGMIHSAERHLACLEKLYFEPRAHDSFRSLQDYGIPWPEFRTAYLAATREQISRSAATRREHRFEDRFLSALRLAGLREIPQESDLSDVVARFGRYIAAEAEIIDGAVEVVSVLARDVRLGLVSNYPYAPVVSATLERFGLRQYFSVLVVSGDLGWLKPHPDVYRTALERIGTRPEETVFVGDDLENDVKGPKALGFCTAWITRDQPQRPHPDADVQLSDLRELQRWCAACLNLRQEVS